MIMNTQNSDFANYEVVDTAGHTIFGVTEYDTETCEATVCLRTVYPEGVVVIPKTEKLPAFSSAVFFDILRAKVHIPGSQLVRKPIVSSKL